MKKKKTFKELFAGTGIEPTTNENGGVDYNFKATLKTNAEASDKAILLTPKGTLTIGEEYSSPSISFYKNNEVEDVITIKYTKFMYKGEEVKDLQTIYDIIKSLTSIELPSDEEVAYEAITYNVYNMTQIEAFKHGVKWMKEKILNQNK
jgi:hypothetical protein